MTAPAPQSSRAPARTRARARDQQTQARGSWETITTALEQAVGPGRPAGAWTRYCCPAHEADGRHHRPSLGVKYDDTAQRTVVRCFAGCDNELVLDKLGLAVRDMFDRRPDPTTRGRAPRARARRVTAADRAIDAAGLPLSKPKPDLGKQVSPWTTTATYPYAREDGTVAGEVVRHEARFTGGRDKRFHQRAWNPESGWADTGFDPIPFQLPRVLEAVREGRTVYICEGEKDVLAAESANLVATTNAGGAGAWKPEHAAWLRGARTVVIVADRDAPGYRRAEKVAASLSGLVERVRVVQAATGKDLHDHLAAGHEVGELEPIPHLDPLTPTPHAAAPAPSIPAAETTTVSAVPSVSPKGPSVSQTGFFAETPAQHSDEVDRISGQWAIFMRLLMMQMIEKVRRQIEANRDAAQQRENQAEEERQAAQAQLAADRAAAEARLQKLRERGFDTADRDQIARAVADAAGWIEDSEIAQKALAELRTHVQDRYGVRLDAATGQVVTEQEVSPELSATLAGLDADRAAGARLRTAQDRMVTLVAGEDLDQSVKEELYADIEQWRTNPTTTSLQALTKKLADKGVGEPVRTRVRFVATYLGVPGLEVTPGEAPVLPMAVSPTTELRKMGGPLVDPGEEAKPRVDRLMEAYQDRLRVGMSTVSVRERLATELAVLTPEDRELARARGNAIRSNPAGEFARLWPDHVDRDELAATVRTYATMAPQAEAAAVRAGSLDDVTATKMRTYAAQHKAAITKAIKDAPNLHPLEKDQLRAVLRDVEAGGHRTPEMLFVDDRSAAALDADRATRIAHDTAHAHRRQVEQLLDTNAVPRGTARRTREDLTRVMDGQAALASGRASLGDYEQTGVRDRFLTALGAAGVGEPMRNRVAAHLDLAASEAASVGKQSHRIADRWAERREEVAAARAPEKPAYDSPEYRADREAALAAAGLDPDQIAQHMAAAAGHAKPAAAAVRHTPGKGRPARSTEPGAGMRRINHRGKGRGDQDQGR
ncbi:toprim domain-containing protein [Nocardia otitidiscaviarum]|uniref:toprim domain-containing protein n=1 Tax=Nocardia otitidiscaviarum TaxID=1823 RepID=UPI00189454B1|nr:toprim domain-containing protein [Nocardia otitidiscaviarum]MBF6138278.1 toprim domain-containing protein [Nocardia otitidiscaviarum]